MKVLISDKTSPKCAKILKNAGHEVDEMPGISPDELKSKIGNYQALIVRSATKVTAKVIEATSNLKVIGRAGSGVDNIDVEAAEKKKIVVMNTPGANANAAAELALAHLFAVSRNLYNAVHSLKEERWDKKLFKGIELEGKKIGILGYGKIGRIVANKCQGLGMEVSCFDPRINKNIVDEDGMNIVYSLDQLLPESDYVSIHLTKKPQTTNLLTKKEFQLMKRGVHLVNCSRGGIVNEKDLLWALNEGIVAMAAMDVFENEPPTDFSLVKHMNVICTPHIGAATVEAQENVGILIAEQISDMFAGKGVRNAVTKFEI